MNILFFQYVAKRETNSMELVDNSKNVPASDTSTAILSTSIALSKSNVNFSVNTLKTLDALINFDDDDDLYGRLESFKNQLREKKMAKEAAGKSKSTDDPMQSKHMENGGLIHESERKKFSLTLKPIATVNEPCREQMESVLDQKQHEQQPQKPSQLYETSKHQQDFNKSMPDGKPVIESNEDVEKSTNERSHSTKKKSSYRKDERRSRRSEDRKSRKSEDRKLRKSEERSRSRRRSRSSEKRRTDDRRSRRSEERRSRRSEEKRHRRSEEHRSKRRHDRSPANATHYRDSYGHYSPQYRSNRSLSPVPPRGPRTPPNTPPPNSTEFDEFRGNGSGSGGNHSEEPIALRHMTYGTPIIPPTAHYQPDLNHQYPTPMSSSHMPGFMNEYAAYMHPNRMHTQPPYNRPPPGIMSAPGLMPYHGPNNEYYYNSSPAAPHHPSANHSHPQQNSFSNLIEVSPYAGMPPSTSNVDCIRKQTESKRKPTIAVQKGNVLEIVPSADVPCDKINETNEDEKSDKTEFMNKQHQQALQRQSKERYKRKMERCQKRLDRNNRKKFLLNELERLSHLMIFGDDGKVAKAGEILKSLVFDGATIKTGNSKELDDDDDDDKEEEIFIEPTIHSYDPRATVGRGILFERNMDRDPTVKRRGVLFADGVAPGNGTSASESDTDDNNINKPKKLSARAKSHKNQKNSSASPSTLNEQSLLPPPSPSIPSSSSFHEKENILDAKVSFRLN